MRQGDRRGGMSRVVLAIDFGGTKVDLATGLPDGTLVERTRIPTDAAQGAEQAVRRAVEAGRALLGATPGTLAAVGVVSPGIVREDGIRYAPNVPGWESLKLPGLLREGFDVETVAYGNDVKAAGGAEARWGALRGADPGLFLSLGTGIGAALVVGGRVVHGAHGAAGEIGYALRGPGDVQGVADGRAPLEEVAGGVGLAAHGSVLVGHPVTAADLFESRDPRVVRLVEETLDELAVQVANLAIALDPERVAVGGGMMASRDRILPVLRERLTRSVPFPPELVPARFLRDSALHGAHALALDALD